MAAEESPAKAVDDARHGVEAVEPAPLLRHDAARIGDRRQEQPKLRQKREGVLHVAIHGVEGREPETDGQGGGQGEQDEQRQRHDLPAGNDPIPGHEAGQDDAADGEIEQTTEERSDGDDESGKVDLGNQAATGDDAAAGLGEGEGEELPGQQGGEGVDGVGHAALDPFIEAGELAEEESKDQHGE